MTANNKAVTGWLSRSTEYAFAVMQLILYNIWLISVSPITIKELHGDFYIN
jgi:hypothetical protein